MIFVSVGACNGGQNGNNATMNPSTDGRARRSARAVEYQTGLTGLYRILPENFVDPVNPVLLFQPARAERRALPAMAVVALMWLLATQFAGAATVLSGNVSGTWTTNGSPYILSADCTVASNQTLTIQPGVEVIIGPAVRLQIEGGIMAIGTPDQWIRIRGTTSSNYWSGIGMTWSGFTNRFHYCRISDGDTALGLGIYGGNQTMVAEILNCDFFNCRFRAVYALVRPDAGSASLVAEINNCVFDSTGDGCSLLLQQFGPNPRDAYLNPRISGNIFKNLRGAALYAAENNGVTGTNVSRPMFFNNTVVNANRGVDAAYPYFDPIVRNNVFLRTSNAVHKLLNGTGMFDIGYNCFFSNIVDFAGGYPGVYGAIVQNNHNGDPCDAFFNIFLDPQFVDTNRFLLANFSPCIDAGDPAIADVCFQFSHGSAISDIGAYGGPDACGWLTHGFAPVITAPPSDQSSCVGGSATFQVRAEGSEPLAYRWAFNGNPLAGETNAQLNLSNLQTNQAGLYSVAVSNTFGSLTSAPARLLVNDACVAINSYAGLSVTGVVGRTYVIDCATNLNAVNWTPLATNTFTTPRWLFVDTNTPSYPGRYFRVRLAP
jgi:hypothetical protein